MVENKIKRFIENQKGRRFMENIFEISVEINSLINVISIKNLCNHNRAKRGYLEKRLGEDRMSGEWEKTKVCNFYQIQ